MTVRTEAVDVVLPGLRAVRWSSDGDHVGLKEAYVVARVEHGTSDWWSGRTSRVATPGSLQLQAPGDICRDRARGATLRLVLTFSASLVALCGESRARRLPPQLEADDARGRALHALHDAVARRADRATLARLLVDAVAALRMLAAGGTHDAGDRTPAVRRALALLDGHAAEAITLDRLAAHASLDKFRLCRAFRAEVGVPPHQYLTRLRVVRAKALLAEGVAPSEVASRVGFYDQSQLTRHFRRIVGTTPARFAPARDVSPKQRDSDRART